MGPKKPPSAKKGAAKLDTAASTKKAKAVDEPEAASSSKRQAMDKGDVSRMLGYLKYHARDGNKDASDKQDARAAMDKYNVLSGQDKLGFLEKYDQNKGSLKWVYTYQAVSQEIESKKVVQAVLQQMLADIAVVSHVQVYVYMYIFL